MNHSDRDGSSSDNRQRQRSPLDEANFIRARLFGNERSSFSRYKELAFRSFSWPKLIRYELLTLLVGPMPGALGLVLRNWLYPSLFRKVGKGVIFGPNLTLRHADRISLGDGVVLDRDCTLDARGAGEKGIVIRERVIVSSGAAIQAKVGHIEIAADCNIGSQVDLVAQGPIIIEENVSIAGKAMIAGGRYVVEMEDGDTRAMHRFTSGAIRVGRNARIGMGAIIQDGVSVGENAIVAPGAVVFESVPANSVVWGNPAHPLRERLGAAAGTSTPGGEPVSPASAETKAEADKPATPDHVRQRVCEYLENDLFIEFGPDDFGVTDSLVDAGVLDSLALVRLSLWTEENFHVDIDLASLDPSQIDTVEKIADCVTQRART